MCGPLAGAVSGHGGGGGCRGGEEHGAEQREKPQTRQLRRLGVLSVHLWRLVDRQRVILQHCASVD